MHPDWEVLDEVDVLGKQVLSAHAPTGLRYTEIKNVRPVNRRQTRILSSEPKEIFPTIMTVPNGKTFTQSPDRVKP